MPLMVLAHAVHPSEVPPPRSDMGRGLFAGQVIPAGTVLKTGVLREVGISRAEWSQGYAIVHNGSVFNRVSVAVGWRLGGTLVYLANCADPDDYQGPAPQTANARYGRRGDELVVRVMQQVGEGEQVIVECYLE